MKKLAIITTHPIQYNAPLFRVLSQRSHIVVKVFYTWGQSKHPVYDAKFGRQRSWDIPLLEGYDHAFVENTSSKPDSNRFFGVINPGLLQQLRDEQFDAVLVYRWSLWSHFLLLQQLPRHIQLLFRGDSVWHAGGFLKNSFRKLLLRLVYRNINTALFVGERNKQYYLKAGLRPQQLVFAPHAVDNHRFAADVQQREDEALEKRRALGIPDPAVVFLYAGKFYALKQLDILVQSFRKLEGNKVHLILLGNGEWEQQLQQLATGDNRIHFLPFANQSQMPVVYRMGDVFVLPSRSETWGLSVNEAMACSRPALVSDACGCAPELIVEGKTGYSFATGNGNDLLHKMRLCTDKERLRIMGATAQRHIEKFSLEHVAEVIEGVVSGKDEL